MPVRTIAAIFLFVYAGMMLGRAPKLRLDRTGIALLGAIAVVVTGGSTLEEARRAVDIPTLALLFALMVVSAQLRLGGFYAWVAATITTASVAPAALLGLLVAGVGAHERAMPHVFPSLPRGVCAGCSQSFSGSAKATSVLPEGASFLPPPQAITMYWRPASR